MSEEQRLIQAAKDGEVETAREILEEGADVHQRDEQGWTPLNWAAGKGDAAMVRFLLEHGADVTLTGRDNRTPLMIAKAAGREEAAAILTEAEKEKGMRQDPRVARLYCKAYYLQGLRRFSGWKEMPRTTRGDGATADEAEGGNGNSAGEDALTDESIVYIHQDLKVTRSMWPDEDVLYENITSEWRQFCEQDMGFTIPDDLI